MLSEAMGTRGMGNGGGPRRRRGLVCSRGAFVSAVEWRWMPSGAENNPGVCCCFLLLLRTDSSTQADVKFWKGWGRDLKLDAWRVSRATILMPAHCTTGEETIATQRRTIVGAVIRHERGGRV